MQPKELPIGYWIKKADELLTKGIDNIQLKFGIDRTSWQILNLIKENDTIRKAELAKLMQPFADENILANILFSLEQENLLNKQSQTLALTAKGVTLHKACFEEQKIFRQKSIQNISEGEYQTTILTLKKLVENLQA